MYQPVALYIGLRYMRGQAADRFGRFVSWLSTIGITLGVMALITVLSVMNGFEQEMENNILALMPQAVITTPAGYLDPARHPPSELASLRGIRGLQDIVPLTQGDVVLQSPHGIQVGVMLGIDPQQQEPLSSWIWQAERSLLPAGSYHVVLGERLASKLGVKPGDSVRLMATSASQFTPMGRIPSQRLFTVSGVFSANSEVDDYQLLVNIQDASRLMRYPPGNISGWRLFLQQPLQVAQLSQQPLPEGLHWQDWRARKGELFQAVSMEKNMMGLLLSLIIAVAAFNIVTSLGLLVMEKQGEVAILQTQGVTRQQIMAIFMIQGAGSGIMGAFLGCGLGVLLASQLNRLTPLLGGILGGAELPIAIHPLQVIAIGLFAMLIALLSTLYPSWRAAAVQPAEALRYE